MTNTMQSRFTPEQISKFRQLLEVKKHLLVDLEQELEKEAFSGVSNKGTGEVATIHLHSADTATNDQIQDMAIQLSEIELMELQQVEEALHRLNKGTYGECMECEEDISWKRLLAIPETPYCKECKIQLEKEASRFKKANQDPTAPSFKPLIPNYPD